MKTMKRPVCIFVTMLMLVGLLSFMPQARTDIKVGAEEPQTQFVPTRQTYISDIKVVGVWNGRDDDYPKKMLRDKGYTVIDFDLNKGVGESAMKTYLGYKTTTDFNNAITDINIRVASSKPNDKPRKVGNREYYLCPYEGDTQINENKGDLNTLAGGKYIHLYYTRQKDGSNTALVDLVVSFEDHYRDSYSTVNLNEGTNGDKIYLHQVRSVQLKEGQHYTNWFWDNAFYRIGPTNDDWRGYNICYSKSGDVTAIEDVTLRNINSDISAPYDGCRVINWNSRNNSAAEAVFTSDKLIKKVTFSTNYRFGYASFLKSSNGRVTEYNDNARTYTIECSTHELGLTVGMHGIYNICFLLEDDPKVYTYFDSSKGSITLSPANPKPGDTVTATITAKEAFNVGSVRIDDTLTPFESLPMKSDNSLFKDDLLSFDSDFIGSSDSFRTQNGSKVVVTGYMMRTPASSYTDRSNWKDWTLYGANVEGEWEVISDEHTDTDILPYWLQYDLVKKFDAPTKPYKYFKIEVHSNQGDTSYSAMNHFGLIGYTYKKPKGSISGKTYTETFTMPNGPVQITAQFESANNYSISTDYESEYGTVTAPDNSYEANTVSFTARPKEGYRLRGVTVTKDDLVDVPLTALYSYHSDSYNNLTDGDPTTEWAVMHRDKPYVILKAEEPVSAGGFALVLGKNKDLSWRKWKLYGANFDSDEDVVRNPHLSKGIKYYVENYDKCNESWDLISEQDTAVPSSKKSYERIDFSLAEQSKPYQYFKIEIESTQESELYAALVREDTAKHEEEYKKRNRIYISPIEKIIGQYMVQMGEFIIKTSDRPNEEQVKLSGSDGNYSFLMPDYPVRINADFVPDELRDNYNISISDTLDINFELDVEGYLGRSGFSDKAKVKVTYIDNEYETPQTITEEYKLNEAALSDGLFLKSITPAFAQIAEPVKIELFDNYGRPVTLDNGKTSYNISVADYCNTIIENADYYGEKIAAAAQSVLDYGKAAYDYFEYTGTAIEGAKQPQTVSPSDITSYDSFTGGSTVGKMDSSNFRCISRTEMKLFIDGNADGLTVEKADIIGLDYDMTYDCEVEQGEDGTYFVRVGNLFAADLNNEFIITLSDGSVKHYSVFDYVKTVLENKDSSEDLKQLVTALYRYNRAVEEAFGTEV